MGWLGILSTALGWIYTCLWTASFFPQGFLNWQRGTTSGTTIDFPAVNTLGFLAYTASNLYFLYDADVIEQYGLRHNGQAPTVRFNDLAFSALGVLACIVVTTQFWPKLWGFKSTEGRPNHEVKLSRPILGIIIGSLLSLVIVELVVQFSPKTDGPQNGAQYSWATIDIVYVFEYIKLVVTLTKYTPQVVTNYRNKSTVGWSIGQILLDFTGGFLSISQLILDSAVQDDWSGITGNPVKTGLGTISIFYDVIFMLQHYVIYRKNNQKKIDETERVSEESPLIGNGQGI